MNPKQVREALRKGKTVRYVVGICRSQADPAIVRVEYGLLRGGRRWRAFYIDDRGEAHSSVYGFVRYSTYVVQEAPCTA